MLHFSELSPSWQALVRLCQSITHGHIEALHVVAGEPTFTPAPTVLVDVKLDQDEGPRPEVNLADFELCGEVRRLLERLDQIKNGEIDRIEIRAGIPRRLVLRTGLSNGQGTHQ
jgi:hypothetical protein